MTNASEVLPPFLLARTHKHRDSEPASVTADPSPRVRARPRARTLLLAHVLASGGLDSDPVLVWELCAAGHSQAQGDPTHTVQLPPASKKNEALGVFSSCAWGAGRDSRRQEGTDPLSEVLAPMLGRGCQADWGRGQGPASTTVGLVTTSVATTQRSGSPGT